MKPKNFPDRKQRRRYEAAVRKVAGDSSRTEKELRVTELAIAAGPPK